MNSGTSTPAVPAMNMQNLEKTMKRLETRLKKPLVVPKVIDLIDVSKFKSSSTTFGYEGLGISIARYTITQLLKTYPFEYAADCRNLMNAPSQLSVHTNVDEQTNVVNNIIVKFDVGILQAVYYPDCDRYVVNFLSENKDQLEELVGRYKELEKNANFYQGKCMRFDREGIAFIAKPSVNLDDVVVPANVFKEFKLNCIDFLLNKDYHENVKKRGLLLYGPPGVGKTSLISAGFNELVSNNISCCFVTTESFTKYPLQHVVNIVVEYLTPAVLVFEDIDLIGRERGSGYDGLVGELLNALNGIGEIKEPLVVIGTTNRVEVLDQAVTRPCRFDRKLELPYPKNGEVHKLFEKICGCLPPAINFDECKITGAHIREIYHTATLLKIKNKKGEITDYIAEATDDVMKSFYLASPTLGFSTDTGRDRPQPIFSESLAKEGRDLSDPFRSE